MCVDDIYIYIYTHTHNDNIKTIQIIVIIIITIIIVRLLGRPGLEFQVNGFRLQTGHRPHTKSGLGFR